MTDYGPSDTSTTVLSGQTTQFPISETYVPNVGLKAVEGGPVSTDGTGKDSAPMGVYVKDGGDVAEGKTTDAAVTGDTSGTISGKLRGLLKIFTDIWDSVNHRIKVDGSGVNQPIGLTGVSGFTPFSAFPVKDLTMKGGFASGNISSFSQGSNTIVLTAPATGLYPNSVIELVGSSSQFEYLMTAPTYVAGSATLITTTNVKNNFPYVAVWWDSVPSDRQGGPENNAIQPWGVIPVGPIAYYVGNNSYHMLACDANGNVETIPRATSWTGILNRTVTNVTSWAGDDIGGLFQWFYVIVDINLTAISTGSIQFVLSRLDANGVAFQLASTAVLTAPTKAPFTFGPGMQINNVPQNDLRIDVVFAGGATVSFTYDAYGR